MKYVLSLDKIDMSQNGIIHMNILDFLLHKKALYSRNITKKLTLEALYLLVSSVFVSIPTQSCQSALVSNPKERD